LDAGFLRAWALDPEDGTLADDRLNWTSDRQGPLGPGELIRLADLEPGVHRLTFTATDSDGQQGSVSTSVRVPR
jgi:hypothetical protein